MGAINRASIAKVDALLSSFDVDLESASSFHV